MGVKTAPVKHQTQAAQAGGSILAMTDLAICIVIYIKVTSRYVQYQHFIHTVAPFYIKMIFHGTMLCLSYNSDPMIYWT